MILIMELIILLVNQINENQDQKVMVLLPNVKEDVQDHVREIAVTIVIDLHLFHQMKTIIIITIIIKILKMTLMKMNQTIQIS